MYFMYVQAGSYESRCCRNSLGTDGDTAGCCCCFTGGRGRGKPSQTGMKDTDDLMVYHSDIRGSTLQANDLLVLQKGSSARGRGDEDVHDSATPGLGLYLSIPRDTHGPQDVLC